MTRKPVFYQLNRFLKNSDGGIAIMFGLMLVPLLLTVGVGFDYARALAAKAALRSAVDKAALAGASVYADSSHSSNASTVATTYISNALAGMPATLNPNYTVSTGTVGGTSNPTGYTVTVTAKAQIPNYFMAIAGFNSTNASVSATAENPLTIMTVDTSTFSSAACDANSVYWYPIPSGVTPTGYVPPPSALTLIWTNQDPTSSSAPITLTSSSAQIGFAMQNVTGTCVNYGSNQYGGTHLSTHMMYSTLDPPSQLAYPAVTDNRSLQVKQMASGDTLQGDLSNLPATASNHTPANAAPSCASLNGKTWLYAWNDMGGNSDDLDYNDVAYTFSCQNATTGSTGGNSTSTSTTTNGTNVILVQ